mgnify:CR=1
MDDADQFIATLRNSERSNAVQKALKQPGYNDIEDPRVRRYLMRAIFEASMIDNSEEQKQ